MEHIIPLATLAVVHLLAVMSPGQSFLVVSRTALVAGRPAALAATLGMGLGILPWVIGAMLGLALLLERAAWLYALLRLVGGLYLVYLAVMVWRHAANPLPSTVEGPIERGLRPAFTTAFLTQIANPKVAVFFGSIFVSVLPENPPLWMSAAIIAIVLINEIGWYIVVSLVLSSSGPRAAYARAKIAIDRVMALALGALGLRLVAEVRP